MRNPRITGWSVVVASVLAMGSVASLVPASADTKDDKRAVDRRIDATREDLEGTSAELIEAWERVQRTEKNLDRAREDLGRARREVAERAQRAQELADRLRVARATEQQAIEDLSTTEKSVKSADDQIGVIARQAIQTGGVGELSVALSAQSADDFAERLAAVNTALQLQRQAIADLDTQRAEVTARKARLTAVRQEIAALEEQARDNLARAQAAERVAASAKAKVESLLSSQRRDARLLSDRRAAEKRRLVSLEAKQSQLEAKLRELAEQARRRAAAAKKGPSADDDGGGRGSVTSSGGYLSYPVPGARVTSEFGMRFHPILKYTKLHTGTDFGAGCGTPIRAAASGTIVEAGYDGGFGNRLTVSHGLVRGEGLATTYNHLSSFARTSGRVERGQVIGYVGNTGYSTGCHLHFETYEDGSLVNPRSWL
ncbi:MAG: peptidoglycan DD-metalloendopeptidase family protein [Actinomycetota bacterium]